jgi:hypothetical protein
VTATYTWDVFSTLDGYGSYGPDGDWGGYWGAPGPARSSEAPATSIWSCSSPVPSTHTQELVYRATARG